MADNSEYEQRLSDGSLYSKKLKKQGFEERVDRAREAMKTAKSPEEMARYKKIEKTSIDIYNKY